MTNPFIRASKKSGVEKILQNKAPWKTRKERAASKKAEGFVDLLREKILIPVLGADYIAYLSEKLHTRWESTGTK